MGLEVSFEGVHSTAESITSDGSEFQVCGAATKKDRRANSVRVLTGNVSRLPEPSN